MKKSMLLLLSYFSRVWLCNPIDGSPPGSPVPGILQARTLECVAISFSSAWKWKVNVKSLSRVWLVATPWTATPWRLPGSSAHGVFQARVLEWVSISSAWKKVQSEDQIRLLDSDLLMPWLLLNLGKISVNKSLGAPCRLSSYGHILETISLWFRDIIFFYKKFKDTVKILG